MLTERVGFKDSLMKLIIPNSCVGCASCVVFCPVMCLEYSGRTPRLIGKCTDCGICFQVCPRCGPSTEEIESFVFGRKRRTAEEFGIYKRIVVARTTDEKIRANCQDGGVVSSILKAAFDEDLIDGAVVSCVSEEKPLMPIPKLVTTSEDAIKCAGTRYVYSPNLLAYREALTKKLDAVAFVGTPCQIRALRRLEMTHLKRYYSPLKLQVGLFCSESFTYEGLVEDGIRRRLGLDPARIKKVNIKGKIMVFTDEGELRSLSLKDAEKYVWNCNGCSDFSAELADISAGGVGLEGWTLTIIRTDVGEDVFRITEQRGLLEVRSIENEPKAYKILLSLSKKKRKRALNS
ncbi:TPA: hypothetical protein EYP70_07150 [Candidatus Bathyarchaeota archaeon]|nr:hypothetical protein [Candidatus Bathyarchaeota archaeon]